MGAAIKGNIRTKVRMNGTRKRVYASPIDKAKGYEVAWQEVSKVFEAVRPYGPACFVYFVGEEDDGPVKIGLSKDPIARLRNMQTGNPRRLRIEHVLVGDMEIEKLLHEMWEQHAIFSVAKRDKVDVSPGTEWFSSQIRARLFPIIKTAAKYQIERLRLKTDVDASELERLVRSAHYAHGFKPPIRDETRFLAPGAGYIVLRPSRI